MAHSLVAECKEIVLTGHKGPVRGLSVVPDGQTIVTGGDDGSVRVWSASNERSPAVRWLPDTPGRSWPSRSVPMEERSLRVRPTSPDGCWLDPTARCCEDGRWTFFCGAQPVFQHAENDRHSFEMFTAQLICRCFRCLWSVVSAQCEEASRGGGRATSALARFLGQKCRHLGTPLPVD